MLERIRLKIGRSPNSPPETIVTSPVTVFVGPNNGGKSLALSEINKFCHSGQKNTNVKIVEDIDFQAITEDILPEIVSKHTFTPSPGEIQQPGHIFFGTPKLKRAVPEDHLHSLLLNPGENKNSFCVYFLSIMTMMLVVPT